jgi:hypothetical protein
MPKTASRPAIDAKLVVAVLEDDPWVCRWPRDTLEAGDRAVEDCASGEAFLEALRPTKSISASI